MNGQKRASRAALPLTRRDIERLGAQALEDRSAARELVSLSNRIFTGGASARAAFVQAIGNLSDPRFIDEILKLRADPAPSVRMQVAAALPLAVAGLDTPPDHVVDQLIAYCKDRSRRVRDWAAFAIGTQMNVDSPAVRKALWGLLSEHDTAGACPAAEAAVGLARRGDPDVVAVIAERLTEDANVGRLWLVAAAESGARALLPVLLTLREGMADDESINEDWRTALEDAVRMLSDPSRTRTDMKPVV